MLTLSVASFAQTKAEEPETAKPMSNAKITRKLSILDIEGTYYENVTATIKSNELYYDCMSPKVKVTVTDDSNNKIWNKTFKNAYLYVFSNGQIQIGRKNFDQMIISKSSLSDKWIGTVREEEGIY